MTRVKRPLLPALRTLSWLLLGSLFSVALSIVPVVANAQSATAGQAAPRTIDWQSTVSASSITSLPRQLSNREPETSSAGLFECERLITPVIAEMDIWLFSPTTIQLAAFGSAGAIKAQHCGSEPGSTFTYTLTDEESEVVEVEEPSDPNLFVHSFVQNSPEGAYTLVIEGGDSPLTQTFTAAYSGAHLLLRDPDSGELKTAFGPNQKIQVDYVDFDPSEAYQAGLYRLGIPYESDAGNYTLVAAWPIQGNESGSPLSELISTTDAPGGSYRLISCTGTCRKQWNGSGIWHPTISSAIFEIDNPVRTVEVGYSVLEEPIEAVQLGNGPRHVVLIGGLHAGFAPASVELAEEAIAHFEDNFAYADELTLHIIPNANPDSPDEPGKLEGRLNDNGVDLNRNWDCNWRSNAEWAGRPVSGGTGPFSEPESVALRDYLLNFSPVAVIAYEARVPNGQVSAGGCGQTSLVSNQLALWYGEGTEEAGAGYVAEEFTYYEVNGDAMNWLDSQGIPAAAVLLPDYDDPDTDANLAALELLLQRITEQATE